MPKFHWITNIAGMENRLHGYDDKAILGISDLMDQGSEVRAFSCTRCSSVFHKN